MGAYDGELARLGYVNYRIQEEQKYKINQIWELSSIDKKLQSTKENLEAAYISDLVNLTKQFPELKRYKTMKDILESYDINVNLIIHLLKRT